MSLPTLSKASPLRVESLEAREVPAVFSVNGLADAITPDGELTLREAISLNAGSLTFNQLSVYEKGRVAGTIGVNDQVEFGTVGTIVLSGNLPTVNKKLTIAGPGAGSLVIDGNALYRPFTVGAAGDLSVTGLGVTRGHSATEGGAVLNGGKATFTQVRFEANSSDKHGGVVENNGTLTVDRCQFQGNAAAKVGGAIDNNATATITNSTIADNTAGNNGGAIWSDGTLTLTNVTMVNNHAANFGGGMRVTGGTATITSCTIVGNDADSDGTTFETGGGISNDGAVLTVNNTVVAQNTRNKMTVKDDVSGTASGQFNVIGVNTALTGITNGANNNRVGTNAAPFDPMLLPLATNGGFTTTQLPAVGSPLIGTGAPLALAGTHDQRGVVRTDGATTVGAVEVALPPVVPPVPPSPPSPPVVPPAPPHVDLYAVGAGAGGSPHVRVFNADGSERFSFYAYAPGFTGGVRVATGDVTGDGVDDIVTAAGAGGGPHVKVFDGTTGAEVRSFFAYGAGFTGGVNVAVGDLNGDGFAEVVTGAGAGGGPHVKAFDGATGAEVRSFFAYDTGFTGGVNVAAGDLDGDGRADVVVGAASSGGPHVKAFDGVTGAEVRSYFAYDAAFNGGVNVAVGDLTGDGKGEIITAAGVGGGPHVKVWGGSQPTEVGGFFAYELEFTGGVRVATADSDGDGKLEVLTTPAGGAATVKLFSPTGVALAAFDAFPKLSGGVFVG